MKKQDKPEFTEITELKAQLADCNNRWKRALADYQNLEKRIREEKTEFIKFSAKGLIEKLLSVVDDLEKAQTHLKDEGLGLALKKLIEVLEQEGVQKLSVTGKDYDIHTMEAIVMEEGKEDGKVLAELRSGYTLHGSVLRPAQVKVSKKSGTRD